MGVSSIFVYEFPLTSVRFGYFLGCRRIELLINIGLTKHALLFWWCFDSCVDAFTLCLLPCFCFMVSFDFNFFVDIELRSMMLILFLFLNFLRNFLKARFSVDFSWYFYCWFFVFKVWQTAYKVHDSRFYTIYKINNNSLFYILISNNSCALLA